MWGHTSWQPWQSGPYTLRQANTRPPPRNFGALRHKPLLLSHGLSQYCMTTVIEVALDRSMVSKSPAGSQLGSNHRVRITYLLACLLTYLQLGSNHREKKGAGPRRRDSSARGVAGGDTWGDTWGDTRGDAGEGMHLQRSAGSRQETPGAPSS